jgi:type IV pilus assembly protein PilC
MATYHYLAIDQGGKRIRGVMEADSERQIVIELRPQGLTIISIKKSPGLFPSLAGKSTLKLEVFKPRVKTKDIIVFFRQFATLINAGLPMVQALATMIDQTSNSSLKEIIGEIKKDVEAGKPLSEALATHPRIFPSLAHNMVRAGEMGGVLDTILTRVAEYLESIENIKERITSAMRYPIFVTFMAGGLTAALIFFILPQIKSLFAESLHAELPALTQFMLNLSDFLRFRFYVVLIIIGALTAAYYLLQRSPKEGYLVDSLKLRFPVLGKLFHKISLSRFARTLALLANSGIPILDSLEMTGKTAQNRVIEKAVEEARSSLKEGGTIAGPLKEYWVFPPMMVNMISVGEQTGALDQMLNKISDFYDQEIENMVNSLASIIEPLLIGFLGITVGIVVIAMYLPYFTMFQHIGG